MPTIEVDFETFKAITARRSNETVTEGDVVREAMGLKGGVSARSSGTAFLAYWESEGVKFPLGMELEHQFRDGRVVRATIVTNGLEVNGKTFGGLSPAGVAIAGYQLNGWRFWYLKNSKGRWVTADSLRG